MWRGSTLAASAVLLLAGAAFADKATRKDESSFGSLRAPDAAEVRKQADAWLAAVGKADAANQAKVKAIWEADRPLLDKVSATLALGDSAAAKLLADARD